MTKNQQIAAISTFLAIIHNFNKLNEDGTQKTITDLTEDIQEIFDILLNQD